MRERALDRSGPPRAPGAAVSLPASGPLAALALALALATAACGDSPAGRAAAADHPAGTAESTGHDATRTRLVVAVVDFSGSLTSHATRDAQAYLRTVVEGLDFGDRLVLLEMYRSGARDSVGKFVQDMPRARRTDAITSYDRRELNAAKRGVLDALQVFFDPRFVGSVRTTDVLTTLHIAAEYLRDARERQKELLILSDMLQSTRTFEFEGARRMPPDGWVDAQDAAGLVPELDGACVVVVGADPTTAQGQRVRAFWGDWFAAAGADFQARNYRARAPVDVIGC